MAVDQAVDSAALAAALEDIADSIRAKGGTSAALAFPAGFVDAVEAIQNSYAAGDEGKVVQNGALVGQTSRNISAAGTYDTTTNDEVVVPSVQQATPSISVSDAGLITASAQQAAGFVAAGTQRATQQLTTQTGRTIIPTTSRQTAVDANRYTTGAVYVAGDANLRPENIADGVTIFNVTGTHSGGGSGNLKYIEVPLTYVGNAYTGDYSADLNFEEINLNALPDSIPIITVGINDGFGNYNFAGVITSASESSITGAYYDMWGGSYSGSFTVDSNGGISVRDDFDNPDLIVRVGIIGLVGSV